MALTEKLTAIADAIRSQSGKAEKLTLDQMPGEITGLQSLSFEVVGNPQPENPKENTIWVDTDAEITGWDFSAAEPANPVEGMVWFSVGTASTVAFNALKENSVMVYPISAKQYVSGAWVGKTATSYQNGGWVDWITYFYKDGNTFDDVTGGYTLGSSNVTLESDNIRMYCDTQNQTTNFFITKSKVDLSGISTLYIKFNYNTVSSYSNKGKLYFYATENVLSGYDGNTGGGATIAKEYAANTSGEDTVSLDVSSVTDAKYIFAAVTTTGKYTSTTFNIKEIWGE